MTLPEFKAWLEGFSAGFSDGVPNADQWEEVQRRLSATQAVRLDFTPYGPRPDDTMTRNLEVICPYFVGDSSPEIFSAPGWPLPPQVTC